MSAQVREYASNSAPHLRAMQEADLEAVMQIESRAYDYPWTLGIFRDCLRSGYGCWVLQREQDIIGYGVLSAVAGEAHILNVCVDPLLHGGGYGRQLMLRLLDLARWHRVERVFLEVRPSNPRAIRLYDSLGFNEIGRRPRYYPAANGREDALVMAQELFYD